MQKGIEGEAFRGEFSPRNRAHRAQQRIVALEAERAIGEGLGLAHQFEPHPRLDTERPAIGGEETGKVGAIGAEEIGAGGDDRPVGEHHVKADRTVHHAAAACTPEGAVLAHPAAHRGADARQGAPRQRPQPTRGERAVERVPADPGFDGGDHVSLVDFDDRVERGGVDQQERPAVIKIAAGIAHPPAARDDGDACRRCRANPGGKFLDRCRAEHREGLAPVREHVVAVQCKAGRISQQRRLRHGLSQRGKRIVVSKAGHHAGSGAAGEGSGSASGKLSG